LLSHVAAKPLCNRCSRTIVHAAATSTATASLRGMKPIALSLAAGALLLTAPAVDAAHSRHKAPATCHLPSHARLLVADAQAEVYETIETKTITGGDIYGCAFGHRHAYHLGRRPEFSSTGGGGISSETLAGPIIAYKSSASGTESSAWSVEVLDLRNGRVVHDVPTGISTNRKSGFSGVGPAKAIVVKSNGSFAWIVETHYEPPSVINRYRGHYEYAVEAFDRTGARLLAASSSDIDPSSLALGGSTLYWTQAGKPFSTTLN
jgi:hypothetical protein